MTRFEVLRTELDRLEREVHALRTEQPTLMGTTEVAEFLGTGRAIVSTWFRRGQAPEPLAKLAAGPIWSKEQWQAWVEETRWQFPERS